MAMFKPVSMKQITVTLLAQDTDAVLKYLGRTGKMQFSTDEARVVVGDAKKEEPKVDLVAGAEDKLYGAGKFLALTMPSEPYPSSEPPTEADLSAAVSITDEADKIEGREYDIQLKKERIENSISVLQSFASVDSSINELKSLSFLNLRVGKIEPGREAELEEGLKNRAVIIPAGKEGEILAISSKKGRFALDSELSKQDFTPDALPDGFEGSPSESLQELLGDLSKINADLQKIADEKKVFSQKYGAAITSIYASCLMSRIMKDLKGRFVATGRAFQLKGWIRAGEVKGLVAEVLRLTGGRAAVSVFSPYEIESVQSGKEKIPVELKHGKFVRTFQPLVLSYGAPLYGTIDPTPITAVFFSLLFAIMFGDVGQGAVLFAFGFLFTSAWGKAHFPSMRAYGPPLKLIGPLSMFSGLLYGSVFANEKLLEKPTLAFTRFLSETSLGGFLGIEEAEHILYLMPEKDNLGKIAIFFGFTIALGVILNSLGLIFFVSNNLTLRRFDKAIFSRNGIVGIAFFWYAISIAVRALIQGNAFKFTHIDMICLAVPVFLVVFGPTIWKIFTAERPLFHDGFFAFVIECAVDTLETVSTYLSNTVSFLRVGAFALSHAVLSFITWSMADKVSHVALGGAWGFLIIIFGNLIIIFLEGMIVAIQVVRLQYYEFFSKFLTDTGTVFKPFRFREQR